MNSPPSSAGPSAARSAEVSASASTTPTWTPTGGRPDASCSSSANSPTAEPHPTVTAGVSVERRRSAVSTWHGSALTVLHRSRGAEMIEKLKRAALVMGAVSGLILAIPETALASSTPTFAHWSSAGAGGASGSLLGASMSLSGPMGTAFYLHDDYPNFNSAAFTPALAATGMVEIQGGAGHAFTLSFGAPIVNPVIDLGSFGSVM